MSYCPKCGAQVNEDMSFCPKCGAPLKAEQLSAEKTAPTAPRKNEKAEKQEKHEKEGEREKTEKHEKREIGFLGPLIGGIILIVLGITSYLQVTGFLVKEIAWALFLVVLGVIIIFGVLYASMTASRRHPKI